MVKGFLLMAHVNLQRTLEWVIIVILMVYQYLEEEM